MISQRKSEILQIHGPREHDTATVIRTRHAALSTDSQFDHHRIARCCVLQSRASVPDALRIVDDSVGSELPQALERLSRTGRPHIVPFALQQSCEGIPRDTLPVDD
jgi:hypothetical protein